MELSSLTIDTWPSPPPLDLGVEPANELQADYRRDGLVILEDAIPAEAIDDYRDEWQNHSPDVRGWPDPLPYMEFPALRRICTDPELSALLVDLVGEPCGVHLNLTGWVSTQRNWHQDGYLNPDSNQDWYAAVWIALADIQADSGPFEFVRGSHSDLGIITRDRMIAALEPHERDPDHWPTNSERVLTPIFEKEIADRGWLVEAHLPKKGDVLVWHPRLLHRGSTPTNPRAKRPALICHYSGIFHRPDFPQAVAEGGGWYFPIPRRGRAYAP